MNFFSFTGDLARGMLNNLGNNMGGNDPKVTKLRQILETCTYPDETKFLIEKAVKQLFCSYPVLDTDILQFPENGMKRRYLEIKGILEIDIKGKACKVDFNMMLPNDFPRSCPYVRIINRNPDFKVDPFYQPLISNTDKSSYILNPKIKACQNWHPSNNLTNIVIECKKMFQDRFPFYKATSEKSMYGGGKSNPWDSLYNKSNDNNFGGGGFNNNNWGNNNNAGNNWGQPSNNAWGNKPSTNNWSTGPTWGNQGGNQGNWGGGGYPQGGMGGIVGTGGMGGIMGAGNASNSIASGQKFVGAQKKRLATLNGMYQNLLAKNQHLDVIRQSLQAEQGRLRLQNYEMTNFLKENEQKGDLPTLTSFVKPANPFSERMLDLVSSVKAREECVDFLQTRFNQQEISLQDFMKQLRKVEEARFEQRALLQKCMSYGG